MAELVIFNHMVKYSRTPFDQSLDNIFMALADPTRRSILHRLLFGSQTVSQVAMPFSISLAAISKHLRVLEEAGLVTRTKQGRFRMCEVQNAALHEATTWLCHVHAGEHAQLETSS